MVAAAYLVLQVSRSTVSTRPSRLVTLTGEPAEIVDPSAEMARHSSDATRTMPWGVSPALIATPVRPTTVSPPGRRACGGSRAPCAARSRRTHRRRPWCPRARRTTPRCSARSCRNHPPSSRQIVPAMPHRPNRVRSARRPSARRRRRAGCRPAAPAARRTTRSRGSASRMIVPEKMWPGTSSSSTINARPSQKKTNARVGSSNVCRNPTNPHRAVDDRRTRGLERDLWPSPSVTVSPSISSRSASVVGATRSMTPSASACSALMLTASVTNDSATSALRSLLGDRAHRGGGVVHGLVGADRAVDTHRGRGTHVRAGRHRGDVARQQNERPRRRRPSARRSDVADHGHVGVQGRLCDLPGRRHETARRVDLDQHGGCPRRRPPPGSRSRGSRPRRDRPLRRGAIAGPNPGRAIERRRAGEADQAEEREGQRGGPSRVTQPCRRHLRAMDSPHVAVRFLRRPAEPSLACRRTDTARSVEWMSATAGRAGGEPRSSEAPYTGRNTGCRSQRRTAPPEEEQQLMEGLLAGNDDAIRALYARYGRRSTRSATGCLARVGGGAHADVFLTAWRKAARFDPSRGRLDVADLTIAHNLASVVDSVAKPESPAHPRARRRGARCSWGRRGSRADRTGRGAAGAVLAHRGRASPGGARVFPGDDRREIAESDGIPLGTVKTRLRSAMIKVRKANEGKELV